MTIQEAGKQILTNNPGKFYIFCGEEYGVKYKYLNLIKDYYGKSTESSSALDTLGFMRRKHLFPTAPQLYIIRYDDAFISSLNDKTLAEIDNTNIIGTIVCIYALDKHRNKCMKYLEPYTVDINKVNPAFIKQYLTSDFPNLPQSCIDLAVKLRDDYMSSYNLCLSMNYAGDYVNDTDSLISLFGSINENNTTLFKQYFAARNFSGCLYVIDNFVGDLDSLFYVMLNALVELERLISNPRSKSDIGRYIKLWNLNNIYQSFTHVYNELKQSRSCSFYNIYDRLLYLISICFTNNVPQLGAI